MSNCTIFNLNEINYPRVFSAVPGQFDFDQLNRTLQSGFLRCRGSCDGTVRMQKLSIRFVEVFLIQHMEPERIRLIVPFSAREKKYFCSSLDREKREPRLRLDHTVFRNVLTASKTAYSTLARTISVLGRTTSGTILKIYDSANGFEYTETN